MSILTQLSDQLLQHKNNALHRKRHILNLKNSLTVDVNQQKAVVFCSNDYLGMAAHPQLINAMKEGVDRYGVGGGSSQLVAGHLAVHHKAEEAFADFLKRDRALLFSTGYMANLGVISALTNKNDVIIADKLVHASLIDASKLSSAKLIRYPHCNNSQLEKQLIKYKAQQKLVVTDSVFSMSGDIADLNVISKLSQLHYATLMVDDAHGIGVLGSSGAGATELFDLPQTQCPVLVCPLAKAFGVMGAIVAGSEDLIEGLVQFARSYIYTTAIPPALAFALLTSLQLVRNESWRRDKLNSNINYFKREAQLLGLNLMPSVTPIQIITIGDAEKAQAISESLLEHGFLLNAMRPPTVAIGCSNLRVGLSCLHSEKQIFELLNRIKECEHALS